MKYLAVSLLLFLVASSAVFAAETDKIARIDVVGNERIDKGVVTNAIKSKEGDAYDPSRVGEDLKSIYKTGYFSDVMVDVKETDKGKAVTFVVVERPSVSTIYVVGNKKVKTEDIRDKLKIKIGAVLNLDKAKESVDEIKRLYASKGYYAAKVSYEIDTEEGYKAALRFIIEEPAKASVKKITFVGNSHIKAKELKSVMRTREKGLFSWFTGSGILDEEAIDEDRKQIEGLYHDRGYVRSKVGVPEIKISKDGKSISINIPLEEGDLYKLGEIEVKGDLIFSESEIKNKLKSKTGNTFRSSLYASDIGTITDLYQDKGYAFVDVAPVTNIDDESRTVNVVFDIAKGSEVFFNRINVIGNVRTRDKVIRRELKVAEGDLYSASNLKESKRKLTNTTYFKSIDLKTVKTDEPDLVNLDVLVEEKPTGTFSLGVGYSTYEKAMITGGVSQENLLGTGWKIYLNASLSSVTHLYDLTIVDPYTLDTNISTALNVFNTQRDFDTYRFAGNGGSLTVARPLTDYLTAALRYRYQEMSVTRVSSDASAFLQNQAGTASTSALGPSLSYNTIDDVLNPTKGTIASASVEVAGGALGATNDFVKATASWGRYFPVKYGTEVFVRGTAGTVRPYGGSTIPIWERFYVGGINTVRGFQYGMAGPLDPATDDPIGALNQLFFNVEWIFPIYRPAALKGVFFFDYGKGFNEMNGFISSLRPAAGFGIRWLSPIGPINVDLGFNLNPKSGEKRSVFDFSMGRPF